MIDGLKLTLTGEEVRKRLAERAKEHERLAEWYREEAAREPDPDDEFAVQLPEHMCEHEEEFHAWRASALAYMREHIAGGEMYLLGEGDLAFGELLPEKPAIVEHADYERDHRVAFSLERIAREISGSRSLSLFQRLQSQKRKPPKRRQGGRARNR